MALVKLNVELLSAVYVTGVYFTSHVEHVKFVDFCGKYRVPLLQYLCSPKCTNAPSVAYTSESESDDDPIVPVTGKMKKVLLG